MFLLYSLGSILEFRMSNINNTQNYGQYSPFVSTTKQSADSRNGNYSANLASNDRFEKSSDGMDIAVVGGLGLASVLAMVVAVASKKSGPTFFQRMKESLSGVFSSIGKGLSKIKNIKFKKKNADGVKKDGWFKNLKTKWLARKEANAIKDAEKNAEKAARKAQQAAEKQTKKEADATRKAKEKSEKEVKKAEKNAEKEARKAEKEAEREAKQSAKDAERAQKKQDDSLPKENWQTRCKKKWESIKR